MNASATLQRLLLLHAELSLSPTPVPGAWRSHRPSQPPSRPCATVFFRHLRKTGGTSLRALFVSDPSFEVVMLTPSTDLAAGRISQGFVNALLTNDTLAASHPRLFIEYHSPYWLNGGPFLTLLKDMPVWRAAQERRGCRAVALTVLREPVSRLVSDHGYFSTNMPRVFPWNLLQHGRIEFEAQLRHLLLPFSPGDVGLPASQRGERNASALAAAADLLVEQAQHWHGGLFRDAASAVALANRILAHFDLVGVTSHLDELQEVLTRELALRDASGGCARPRHANLVSNKTQATLAALLQQDETLQALCRALDSAAAHDCRERVAREALRAQTPVSDKVYQHWRDRWEGAESNRRSTGTRECAGAAADGAATRKPERGSGTRKTDAREM